MQTQFSMLLQILPVAFEIFQAFQTTLRRLEQRLAHRDLKAYIKKKKYLFTKLQNNNNPV